MLIIGLTGPSGAGKGLVASLFARYGVPSIDTDAVYHELLIPPSVCLDELVAHFGRGILTGSGVLDRRALAAQVFAPGQEAELEALNRITHKHVLHEVRRRCRALELLGKPAVLVDAPQLFESGFDTECDKVLSVLASRELRIARIRARDGLDEERATARIDAQRSDEEFRSRSDAVILNEGTPEEPDADVQRLLTEWGVPHAI